MVCGLKVPRDARAVNRESRQTPCSSPLRTPPAPLGTPPTHPSGTRAVGASPAPTGLTSGRPAPREATGPRLLEKNASRVSTTAHQDARRRRYDLRDALRDVSPNTPRLAKCGRCRRADQVQVRRGVEGRAHFNGLTSCGSVWACPVCAAKIAARRAEEVALTLSGHFAAGGGVVMLTLTLPHTVGDRLKRTRTLAAAGWKRVMQGRAWLTTRDTLGVVGFIRTLEVTHTANGWHPHVHALVLTERPLGPSERDALQLHAFGAWRAAVVKQGHPAPQDWCSKATTITDEGIAQYATKMGAALELTQGAGKLGRSTTSRTPFAVALDYFDTGDADDLALWMEWQRDMKGARQLTWSKGLKARYAITEQTDEQIAAAEVPDATVMGVLSAGEWAVVVAVPGLRVRLLEAAERNDGGMTLDRILSRLRVPPP